MDTNAWEKLHSTFETRDILDAVGHIDDARGYLNDGEDCRPPEVRTEFLKLHRLAMKVVDDGERSKARDVRNGV